MVSGAWNNSNSLLSRLIVAGGGGSDGATNKSGMYGGGTTGGTTTESYSGNGNYCGQGGTQTCSGKADANATSQATSGLNSNNTSYYYGGFGFGGRRCILPKWIRRSRRPEAGGWYGGSGNFPDSSGDDDRGGGGGSGFIWVSGASVPSGYSVDNKYQLSSAETIAGNQSFVTTSGSGSETGHSGDGYAKITPINVTGQKRVTTSD